MNKFFILFFVLVTSCFSKPQDIKFAKDDEKIEIESPGNDESKSVDDTVIRAASTFVNCHCQCDSYIWVANGKTIQGNCSR